MYSIQLKPNFNSIAKRFATKPLLSTAALRTLSYVVYLQPVSAHELVQRRGYSGLFASQGFVGDRFPSFRKKRQIKSFQYYGHLC